MPATHIFKQLEYEGNTAVQSQKAVSAHFTSNQIVPFGFAEQNRGVCAEDILHNDLVNIYY